MNPILALAATLLAGAPADAAEDDLAAPTCSVILEHLRDSLAVVQDIPLAADARRQAAEGSQRSCDDWIRTRAALAGRAMRARESSAASSAPDGRPCCSLDPRAAVISSM